MRVSGLILPWAVGAATILFAVGLYWSLYLAPPDFKQGDGARIIFIHVPAAALSIGIYAVMVIASVTALIWRHPVSDLTAKSCAPVGAAFTLIALITGSIWGKPMWGAWWVWDARLTAELILLFFYLGYMALWSAVDDQTTAARAAAILCCVGSVSAVISKYSVNFANTLHQPASLSVDKAEHVHNAFYWPLLVMMGAFYAYFMVFLLLGVRKEIRLRRIRNLQGAMAREVGA